MAKRRPRPEDEAVAWLCECGHLESDDEHEPEPLYECGECGIKFTKEGSADGGSCRCPDCNKFSAKVSEHGCPECCEEPMEGLVSIGTVLQPTTEQPICRVCRKQLDDLSERIKAEA